MVDMSSVFAFSDLLRRPNDVVAALESGDVVLERRGQANLRLVVDAKADKTFDSVRVLAHVFRSALQDDVVGAVIVEALKEEFAWIDLLPKAGQVECARELLRAAQSGSEIGDLSPFAQCVVEWRNTATVYADPELLASATRPLTTNGELIPRPGK